MPRVPESVVKESYQLKSTFFYNRLRADGYFQMFLQVQNLSRIEGAKLKWDKKADWKISEEAWKVLEDNSIDPMLVFVHPKILKLYPTYLKYYRSVAMLPQKGLKSISHVSNVERIEAGNVEAGTLSNETVDKLVKCLNEVMSLVITLATDISEKELEGMMYATAGTNIDGSWRNSIGAEGERVIRSIILRELAYHHEVTSITDRQNNTLEVDDKAAVEHAKNVDNVKTINLSNGYSVLFASEPDVTMFDDEGAIVGIIEIKSGLDPAGALERLGAMFKSFDNTLAEYPNAVTILVASCITDEVESRLGAAMSVRQKYITTEITSSEKSQRMFVNRLRKIMQLINEKRK
ncbi:MAG: XcyI family restriction endonuclease [Solobacterium sp.]|nr:XcyI family restriction endonuclease [Solobacterium sp.]